jgi:hypothetical protein
MARASVAEQTGSTGELEAAAKFTRINWGYAVVLCLMIPLSSAAGYFDDQEHRGGPAPGCLLCRRTGIHLPTS